MAKTTSKSKAPNKQGFKKGNHSLNPDRQKDGLKGVAKPRTKSTINRLLMYKNFKPVRNKVNIYKFLKLKFI